jgi:hypothetical protein
MSTRRALKKDADRAPSSGGRVVPLRREAESPAAALGRGAHFAKLVQKQGEGRYEAQLMSGERLALRLAPEVDMALADRCLAEQSVVLVGALGDEVLLFGALRTRERSEDEVVVEAPRRLVLRSGKAKLVLSADGKVKLSGNEVTVDAPREVRIASAKVEIP